MRPGTRVARAMIAVLLFAQAAMASAACEAPRVAPVQAFAAAETPTCHDEPVANANLCLAHCLGADQSADTPQVAIGAWNTAPVLMVAAFDRAAALRPRASDARLARSGAPPPRILFQSFLI